MSLFVTDFLLQILLTNLSLHISSLNESLWSIALVLSGVTAVGFALLADYRRQRTAVIIGIAVTLAALTLSLLPTSSELNLALVLAYVLGGGFTLYFLLTITHSFLSTSRYPALMAVAGILFMEVRGILLWPSDLVFPSIIQPAKLSIGFYIAAILCTLVLLITTLLVLDGQGDLELTQAVWKTFYEQGEQRTDLTDSLEASASKNPHNTAEPLPTVPDIETRMNAMHLTMREREVVALLLTGRTTGDIARELYLSEKTVRNYINALLNKTETHSRIELLAKFR
jgi:DNA-binding CsgD family transcriptional regulator